MLSPFSTCLDAFYALEPTPDCKNGRGKAKNIYASFDAQGLLALSPQPCAELAPQANQRATHRARPRLAYRGRGRSTPRR